MQTENTIDAKIQQLFEVLNKKKKEVEDAEQASSRKWKTNCSFPSVFSEQQRNHNIQTATHQGLVNLLTDLLIRDTHARQACEMMGVPYDGQWGGFSIDHWVEDFKTRAAKIQVSERKRELADLHTRLDAIVSPEQRRQMELEAITKSLTGE